MREKASNTAVVGCVYYFRCFDSLRVVRANPMTKRTFGCQTQAFPANPSAHHGSGHTFSKCIELIDGFSGLLSPLSCPQIICVRCYSKLVIYSPSGMFVLYNDKRRMWYIVQENCVLCLIYVWTYAMCVVNIVCGSVNFNTESKTGTSLLFILNFI